MTKVNTNGVIRKSIIYVWEKKSSSPDVCEMNRPGYGGGGPGGQNPEDKKRIREAEMRKLYANSWAVELMKAPCARPGFACTRHSVLLALPGNREKQCTGRCKDTRVATGDRAFLDVAASRITQNCA